MRDMREQLEQFVCERSLSSYSVCLCVFMQGYGFIGMPGETEDVFVHQSDIHARGFRSLCEGEMVEFDLITEKGRKKAIRVTGPNGEYVVGDNRNNRGGMGGGGYGMGGPGEYGGGGGGYNMGREGPPGSMYSRGGGPYGGMVAGVPMYGGGGPYYGMGGPGPGEYAEHMPPQQQQPYGGGGYNEQMQDRGYGRGDMYAGGSYGQPPQQTMYGGGQGYYENGSGGMPR
eukprot:GHVS01076305.1.p1 GENE.GHVS01076305.1~~GHVS01076305.1.p1  ORF type:complete len:228 (+),score=42.95 GHVS01076305.1:20-703(+)